jgi:hypothetical protein
MKPKVFISYSWTSQNHQNTIREWAEKLINDGVEVLFDQFDLKEGNDKYAYMEKMITDQTVTHVLAFCDEKYQQKADSRESGVGTESQIISNEIYNKVDQSKIIPIVCEKNSDGEEYLPIFFKNLIWIDFSSPELAVENWERLIRLLYGKPLYQKPKLGNPPSYIINDVSVPTSSMKNKFLIFKNAFINDKKTTNSLRNEFLEETLNFADSLRIRSKPEVDTPEILIIETFSNLNSVRNILLEWLKIESNTTPQEQLLDILIPLLEKIRELKSRPKELSNWSEHWFDAHSLFVNEVFLYITSILIKNKSYNVLNEIFQNQYLIPESENRTKNFENFSCFFSYSEELNRFYSRDGKIYHSPAAELFKRNANSEIISFSDLIEAELLILFIAYLRSDIHWYPQLIFYRSQGIRSNFFLMLSKKKEFEKFRILLGDIAPNTIKPKITERLKKINFSGFGTHHVYENIILGMNLDNLNSI